MENNIKLVNGSVLLCPYSPEDAASAFEAARESFLEAGIWLPWCRADYSMEESRKWIESCGEAWERGTAYEFAIMDPLNRRYFGGCGLNHIDSGYVAEKAGARREGILRNRIPIKDVLHDAVVFSFIPQDLGSISAAGRV